MNAKTSIYVLLSFLCLLAIAPSAWCKRSGAPVVEPVICDGTKCIAPNDDGIREYVEAWDVKTEKKLWEATIFINSIQPGLEKDVQWVFIERLQCEKGNLLITDEHSRQFLLNLKTK